MVVKRSKQTCPIYDLKKCVIKGYPPSCEVLDATPRNPCPTWTCEEKFDQKDITFAKMEALYKDLFEKRQSSEPKMSSPAEAKKPELASHQV